MAKLTTEEFIAKAKAVHGDRYDYSKVKYVNNQTPVEIVCPIHGTFIQRPLNHLRGNGCPQCGLATILSRSRTLLTQEEARKRISEKLSLLPYELVEPFLYKGDRRMLYNSV